MFEKFGSSLRRALLFSRCEAARLGCAFINPEVILLGILDERDPVLLKCLERFGQTTTVFRDRIERVWREKGLGFVADSGGELPLSEEAKKILALSAHFATSERHPSVKPGHMLWAMTDIVPDLLDSLFGQVPRWVEDESDDDYLGLPDRLEVSLGSVPNSAQATASNLWRLVEEFELALREKRFAEILPLNERIETLRAELITLSGKSNDKPRDA